MFPDQIGNVVVLDGEELLLLAEPESSDHVLVAVFLVAAPCQLQLIFASGTGIEPVPSGSNIVITSTMSHFV